MTLLLPSEGVFDPHCHRSSEERLPIVAGRLVRDFKWGRWDAIGTAAFWVNQTARGHYIDSLAANSAAATLQDEILFCLLGGFGVTAELAAAAFDHLQARLDAEGHCVAASELERWLREPLEVGERQVRYRFPAQRATRIAAALQKLNSERPPTDPRLLRGWLLEFVGIGPKTASWITRNLTGTSEVAIIDIWITRALRRCGVFAPAWDARAHYPVMEDAFLQFAAHGQVPAAALDLCIWSMARAIPDRTLRNGPSQ